MKLRNKKTGGVVDLIGTEKSCPYIGISIDYHDGNPKMFYYNSLTELNEEWEDYTPTEALIKDPKIRKAVRAWADYHIITEVKCCIGTWDHAGICLPDSVLQLQSIRDRIGIQFFMDANKREKIKEGIYSIDEVCGEEVE